jgi:hypothetical protein
VLRAKRAHESKVGQRIDAFGCDHVNAAAETAFTTVRPAKRNEFFAAKTQAAAATVTGLYFDDGFVDEFHENAAG